MPQALPTELLESCEPRQSADFAEITALGAARIGWVIDPFTLGISFGYLLNILSRCHYKDLLLLLSAGWLDQALTGQLQHFQLLML